MRNIHYNNNAEKGSSINQFLSAAFSLEFIFQVYHTALLNHSLNICK